ncbi:S-type pyocin domain-containing protein [Type-D symbiont of Plautia stali]|uniref:S-type pyocin domain-containing protein n=1 Tax=Type-D symbiont of Plautia stali TaxID=1560356 RepID=UPI00073E78DC|nr:S-type pyocin domain-containing protein [Type-D symbiont of Plautia stali]
MSEGNDQGSMTVNGPSTDPGSESPRGNGGGNGSDSSGNGGGGGNKQTAVSKQAGDAQAASLGLSPEDFTGYFLNADGEVIGISSLVGGDAYGVNLGAPPEGTDAAPEGGGTDGADVAGPLRGGHVIVTFRGDTSDNRIRELNDIIARNETAANSGQSGARPATARRLTAEAKAELALIDRVRQKQADEAEAARQAEEAARKEQEEADARDPVAAAARKLREAEDQLQQAVQRENEASAQQQSAQTALNDASAAVSQKQGEYDQAAAAQESARQEEQKLSGGAGSPPSTPQFHGWQAAYQAWGAAQQATQARQAELDAATQARAAAESALNAANNALSQAQTEHQQKEEARKAAEDNARAVQAAADRDALFSRAGVEAAPSWSPESAAAGTAALSAADSIALNRAPGAVQLAYAGSGTWSAASGEALTGAVSRGLAALSGAAGAGLAAVIAGLWPAKAGEGSARVPVALAIPARLLTPEGAAIDPAATSAGLAARGKLTLSGGQPALQLLKPGAGLSATVPVLKAVRDAATGLDRITVPAVAGAPERTVLINPAPPPAAPSDTGGQAPAPVTPAHTGTDVTAPESLTVTTLPEGEYPDLQDFIYWQPDAAGTGVEPVYVMFISPRELPGTVSGEGESVGDDWLNAAVSGNGAPVPEQIADKLRGREFANFDAFRKAFWTEVEKDPELSKQFREGSLGSMKLGKSSFVRKKDRVGGRIKHELHHVKPISEGGAVYDVNNLRVMTPKLHIEVHRNNGGK